VFTARCGLSYNTLTSRNLTVKGNNNNNNILIFTIHRILLFYAVQEERTREYGTQMGETVNICKVLVGKPKGKRSLVIPRSV
jgi:hypothetical protein